MKAIFSMLKTPRTYPAKGTGELRTAHNIEIKVLGEGTGDVYVSEDVYRNAMALGLKDGEEIEVNFGARVFRGNVTPVVTGIARAS
jgi:hypothetical protein